MLNDYEWSKYLPLYDQWKSSKGKEKDKPRNQIKALYNNTIYAYYDTVS